MNMKSTRYYLNNIFRNYKYIFLIIVISGIITVVQSDYVGDVQIYTLELEDRRVAYHDAIFNNNPVGHKWGDRGDSAVNIRILTVYLVEYAHRLTGISLLKTYKLVDMAAIFASLILSFLFFKRSYTAEIALIAILYLGSILPLTYAYHAFHPYDRPGLLLWILFAWAVRDDRFYLAIPILLIAVLNKYDAVVLPGLYFLTHLSRTRFVPVVVRTIALFALTFGLFFLLRSLLPGGFADTDIVAELQHNIELLLRMNLRYPPLLAFGLPLGLAIYGWRAGDQFSRAGFLMALAILLGPLFLLTNFEEVRAEMGALFLLLPLALAGLERAMALHRANSATT